MILPNITIERKFSQAMKHWYPVELVPNRVYTWLWWNFEFIEPKELSMNSTETSYSYCEYWSAGSLSNWHIRRLTSKGKKLSGGTDTLSLCGRKMTWDITSPVTKDIPANNICKKCQEIWEKEIQETL
jgi:hypothetical protein